MQGHILPTGKLSNSGSAQPETPLRAELLFVLNWRLHKESCDLGPPAETSQASPEAMKR